MVFLCVFALIISIFPTINVGVYADDTPQYGSVQPLSEGLSAVLKNGKWGYINEQGETVIPFNYDLACNFKEGKAIVSIFEEKSKTVDGYTEKQVIGKLGFIDKNNNYTPFLAFNRNNDGNIIKKQNKVEYHNFTVPYLYFMISSLDEMSLELSKKINAKYGNLAFNEGYITFDTTPEASGIFTSSLFGDNGKEIDTTITMTKELATNSGFNPNEKIELNGGFPSDTISNQAVHEGLLCASPRIQPNLSCFYNPATKTVLNNAFYAETSPYVNGIAAVRFIDKDVWLFIDKQGNVVGNTFFMKSPYNVDAQTSKGSYFKTIDDNLSIAIVQNENKKYGVISSTGEIILPFEYDEIVDFSEGLFTIKKFDVNPKQYYDNNWNMVTSGKYGFVDMDGNVIIEPQYDDVTPFNNSTALVLLDDKISIIDKTGKNLYPNADIPKSVFDKQKNK